MPMLDGTGPEGKGPKTGRNLGKCEDKKNIIKRPFRLGFGRGRKNPNKQSAKQGR